MKKETLVLGEGEREVVVAEAAQAMEQVPGPEMRRLYAELLAAADRGEVPAELVPPLEALLEVGLESGRIRKLHTAHGEAEALRLYARTPKGRALRDSTEAVNAALIALRGHRIEEIAVAPAGPGAYTLTVGTEQGRLSLRLDRQGARLQSLEVGA